MEQTRHKVTLEEMATLPKRVIACDFDGFLVTEAFPEIGEPIQEIVNAVREAQLNGAKIVLWTCRDHQNLTEAVAFCRDVLQLDFDAVNENIPEVKAMFGGNDTRKIWATEYWDDKNVVFEFADVPAPHCRTFTCPSCGTFWVAQDEAVCCPVCTHSPTHLDRDHIIRSGYFG